MSCVHEVEVEWFYAVSCLRRSLGGIVPRRIAVCRSWEWQVQEQRSCLRKAPVTAVHGGLGEGGRVGAVEEGVELVAHDFVGEARRAVAFVIRNVCMVIGNANVRWDVTGCLNS